MEKSTQGRYSSGFIGCVTNVTFSLRREADPHSDSDSHRDLDLIGDAVEGHSVAQCLQ